MTGPGDLAPSTLERIRHDLVGLKMPRALEALDQVVRRLCSTSSRYMVTAPAGTSPIRARCPRPILFAPSSARSSTASPRC